MKSQKEKWKKAFLDSSKRKWLFGFTKTRIVDLMLNFIYNTRSEFRRVVDVGCGSGRNALALAKLGFEVYGIDFLEDAILSLRKRAKRMGIQVNSLVCDLTKPWPFSKNFFDVGIVNVVLDSIDREGRFFIAKELARVLKKNGLLFIYEPSVNDGYYKQFVNPKGDNFCFTCPDDGIKREIFTRESILQPFKGLFKVRLIEERRHVSKMFGKEYERVWWYVVLQNEK